MWRIKVLFSVNKGRRYRLGDGAVGFVCSGLGHTLRASEVFLVPRSPGIPVSEEGGLLFDHCSADHCVLSGAVPRELLYGNWQPLPPTGPVSVSAPPTVICLFSVRRAPTRRKSLPEADSRSDVRKFPDATKRFITMFTGGRQ
jgi:hypothetical protein